MNYKIYLESRAEKELKKLPKVVLVKVDKRILSLIKEPRPKDVKMLKGK